VPGIPDWIMKPKVFERMEILSRNTALWQSQVARDKLKAVVADLADTSTTAKPIIDIAKGAWLYDADSTEHFHRHWLNRDKDGYWKNIQNQVDAVLRAGMRQVCEMFIASGYSRPFEYLWVISGAEGSTEWRMSICEGPSQVTVIFQTPQTKATTTNYVPYPPITVVKYDTTTNKVVIKPMDFPV